MGSALRPDDTYHVLGKNTDLSDPSATATTKVQVPMDKGGVQLEGSFNLEEFETEHGTQGSIMSEVTRKNDSAGSLALPFHPQYASILRAATELTAEDLPGFRTLESYGYSRLGVAKSGNSSPDLGERRIFMPTGVSISIDRATQPTKIGLQVPAFVRLDRRIPAAASTSATDGSTPGTQAFTLANASAFRVGDYVLIEETGGSFNSETVVLTAISGNDVTATTTVGLDGSSDALDVTKVAPAIDLPQDLTGPFMSSFTYLDLQFADRTTGAFPSAWGGDNADALALDMAYDGNIAVEDFRPDATDDDNNQSWRTALPGTPSLQGSIRLRLTEDDYLNIKRAKRVPKLRYRLMGTHSTADIATTTGGVVAGTNVVVPVDTTTGFAVDQVVLLDDGNKQAVGVIAALVADTSITIARLDADIGIAATVLNKAWMVKVDSADITQAPKQPGERYVAVQISYAARVVAGNTQLVEVLSYDHAA